MILVDASSQIVSSAKVGKSCGFSTLELSNMTLVFLPPNATSVVQLLDQLLNFAIIAFITFERCYFTSKSCYYSILFKIQ